MADSNNSSVQIFDGDGNLELLLGIRGRKPGNLQRPTGSHVYRLIPNVYQSRASSSNGSGDKSLPGPLIFALASSARTSREG